MEVREIARDPACMQAVEVSPPLDPNADERAEAVEGVDVPSESFTDNLSRLLAIVRSDDVPRAAPRSLAAAVTMALGCGMNISAVVDLDAGAASTDTADTSTADEPSPPRPPGWTGATVTGDVPGESTTSIDDTSGTGTSMPFATTGEHDAAPVVDTVLVQGSPDPEPVTQAGAVSLTAFVRDDHGVARVEFYVDGELVDVVDGHDDDAYYTTVSIDHQDDAGEHAVWVVAVDDADQESVSWDVEWTVTLPPSGTIMVSHGVKPVPEQDEAWHDVAVAGTGELYLIGYRQAADESPRLLVQRRDADGGVLDDEFVPPVPHRQGVAGAFADDGSLVVLAQQPGGSWIGRYDEAGVLVDARVQDGVEWRDLQVAGPRTYVVGNKGELGMEPTWAQTWSLDTFALADAHWIRNAYDDGDDNTARAVVTGFGFVVAVGHITAGDNQRRGAVWAYETVGGDLSWSHTFDTPTGDIADVVNTAIGFRTVGTVKVDGVSRVHLLEFDVDGILVDTTTLLDIPGDSHGYALVASSHDDVIIAGATCEDECRTLARRYAGDALMWEQTTGLVTPVTRVHRIAALEYGYALLLGWSLVNYGYGPQHTSWLRVVHP